MVWPSAAATYAGSVSSKLQASVAAAVEAACSEVHAARRDGDGAPVVCVTGSLHIVAQALQELPLAPAE